MLLKLAKHQMRILAATNAAAGIEHSRGRERLPWQMDAFIHPPSEKPSSRLLIYRILHILVSISAIDIVTIGN